MIGFSVYDVKSKVSPDSNIVKIYNPNGLVPENIQLKVKKKRLLLSHR
jgi:hypothetical protein